MVFVWNCHELGNPEIVRAFMRLIKAENPLLIFIIETKMLIDYLEKLKWKFGYGNGGTVCTWWTLNFLTGFDYDKVVTLTTYHYAVIWLFAAFCYIANIIFMLVHK